MFGILLLGGDNGSFKTHVLKLWPQDRDGKRLGTAVIRVVNMLRVIRCSGFN